MAAVVAAAVVAAVVAMASWQFGVSSLIKGSFEVAVQGWQFRVGSFEVAVQS